LLHRSKVLGSKARSAATSDVVVFFIPWTTHLLLLALMYAIKIEMRFELYPLLLIYFYVMKLFHFHIFSLDLPWTDLLNFA